MSKGNTFLSHSGVRMITYLNSDCIKQIEELGYSCRLNAVDGPDVFKPMWQENDSEIEYSLYFRLQYLIDFNNGFALSVIKMSGDNNCMDDFWEVAVKCDIGYNNKWATREKWIFWPIDNVTDDDGLIHRVSDKKLIEICEQVGKLINT